MWASGLQRCVGRKEPEVKSKILLPSSWPKRNEALDRVKEAASKSRIWRRYVSTNHPVLSSLHRVTVHEMLFSSITTVSCHLLEMLIYNTYMFCAYIVSTRSGFASIIITKTTPKSTIIWIVTPCSSVEVRRRFGEIYRLRLHGRGTFPFVISTGYI
jgi:hypothetical protein